MAARFHGCKHGSQHGCSRGQLPKRGWCAFQCFTATAFDTATKCNITGLAGATVPAGTILYGLFSQIKLTSGSGIAYNAVEPASNPIT